MILKEQIKKKENVLCILYILLLTFLCYSLALNQSVWMDESLSMRWTALPFGTMMKVLIGDVHPPLFYILLKFFVCIDPDNVFLAKIFIVIGLFLTILPAYYFLKKRFGKAPLFFYTLFLLSLPMMLTKTVEIRMYTWGMCFTVMTGIFMYHVMKNPVKKNWICFILFGLATAYTHYYGLIAMVFLYPMLLLFFVLNKDIKNIKNWFLYSVITAIGYLPWLPIALNQVGAVNNDYWIEEATLMSYLKGLFRVEAFPHSTKIYFAIIFVAVIYLFYKYIKTKDMNFFWGFACAVPFVGTMLFGMIYGSLVKPVMVERYLLIPLALLLFGISIFTQYINKYITAVMCVFFAVMLMFNYPVVFEKEYYTDTDITLEFFEEKIEEDANILFTRDDIKSVVMFYMPEATVTQCLEVDAIPLEYEEFWFFDSMEFVKKEADKLHGYNIELCGEYGLDNASFTIYYFSKK